MGEQLWIVKLQSGALLGKAHHMLSDQIHIEQEPQSNHHVNLVFLHCPTVFKLNILITNK